MYARQYCHDGSSTVPLYMLELSFHVRAHTTHTQKHIGRLQRTLSDRPWYSTGRRLTLLLFYGHMNGPYPYYAIIACSD